MTTSWIRSSNKVQMKCTFKITGRKLPSESLRFYWINWVGMTALLEFYKYNNFNGGTYLLNIFSEQLGS